MICTIARAPTCALLGERRHVGALRKAGPWPHLLKLRAGAFGGHRQQLARRRHQQLDNLDRLVAKHLRTTALAQTIRRPRLVSQHFPEVGLSAGWLTSIVLTNTSSRYLISRRSGTLVQLCSCLDITAFMRFAATSHKSSTWARHRQPLFNRVSHQRRAWLAAWRRGHAPTPT